MKSSSCGHKIRIMEMKFSCCIILFLLITGCSKEPANLTISKERETLQEATFEIEYPSNWKITSEVDRSSMKIEKTVYTFHHPQSRQLLVEIEMYAFMNDIVPEGFQLRSIISKKVRDLKREFEKEGYRQFNFETKGAIFANYRATRLVVKAQKGDVTRHSNSIILPHVKDYHIITYQWFSNWDKKWIRKIAEIVNTFQLTR